MSDEIKFKLGAMSEKIDKLVELNEKQTDNIQQLQINQVKMSTILEVNTQELHEHKEGVIQNRTHIKALETQLADHAAQSIENTKTIEDEIKPLLEASNEKKYVRQWIKKWGKTVISIGAVASAVAGIAKFFGMF